MKIKFSVFVLVCLLLLSSCSKTNEAYVGMSMDEFNSFMEGNDVFLYGPYAFWHDERENYFAAEFSNESFEISRIESFSNRDGKPTKRDFENIIEGMDIFQVVEILGNPLGSTTSGLSTLDFEADDGMVYRIHLDATAGYKVIEVYPLPSIS